MRGAQRYPYQAPTTPDSTITSVRPLTPRPPIPAAAVSERAPNTGFAPSLEKSLDTYPNQDSGPLSFDDLAPYQGQWVLLRARRVIDVASSPQELTHARDPHDILFLVPHLHLPLVLSLSR